ncbi:DUF4097 family beta strand repeat-containing protein [Nonomuraea sp. NPDC002799]
MRMKRTAVIAGLLGLAAVSAGCGIGPTQTDTVSYDVTDEVTALRVEADSGTIEVVESDRRGVHVSERLTWSKDKPKTRHAVQGGTLALAFECPATWGPGAIGMSCDVSYQVEVPKGLRVNVRSDSGTLTLKNLSGALDATTDSGTIEASGLTGKQVVTHTDSGDMTLTFTGQPDKVSTTTDSGSTAIHVPEGPYHVVTKTDSGGRNVKVADDPSAQRSITLSSDSGDLEVLTP